MTPREIERAIDVNRGHLCVRAIHRSDGSLVTLGSADRTALATRAAGLVVGIALATGTAQAQSNTEPGGKALVSGIFTATNGDAPPAGSQVVFIANGTTVLATNTDATGNWSAQLDPGTYDVIFRLGPLFGERVNAVQLHAGEQSFAPVKAHFAYRRLGLEDHAEQFTTLGVMVATYKYPVSYFFKHPILYLKHLPHNFS
jgi:DNA-binding transcriptional LysR family regulator